MPKPSRSRRRPTRAPADSGETEVHRPGMKGRTDWKRVRGTTDAEIDEQIASDPDTAPAVDEDWMEHAELVVPVNKQAVSIRLDDEVLNFFKGLGRGYQTRINTVLLSFVRAQQKHASDHRTAQREGHATQPRGRRKAET